jgi:hypothetical protein
VADAVIKAVLTDTYYQQAVPLHPARYLSIVMPARDRWLS